MTDNEIREVAERIANNLFENVIVRCKDCENWDDDLVGYCTLNDCFGWGNNDFCSRGERKTKKTE